MTLLSFTPALLVALGFGWSLAQKPHASAVAHAKAWKRWEL